MVPGNVAAFSGIFMNGLVGDWLRLADSNRHKVEIEKYSFVKKIIEYYGRVIMQIFIFIFYCYEPDICNHDFRGMCDSLYLLL